MFSQRSEFEENENSIGRRLRQLRAAGLELLDLTISTPADAGLTHDATVLQGLASPTALHYTPDAQGLQSAREALAADLQAAGHVVEIDDLILTSGTSEAYSYLFKLLCDPGDEVLIPAPSYPLFEHLAQLEGVRVARYPLAYDGSFHIDMPVLRRMVTPHTRAIVVVNPNNPTGSFLKRDEFSSLLNLGLPIISDEVFAAYAFGPGAERVDSVLETQRGLVFALGGLSKAAALPQLKLSFIAVGGEESARARARQRLAFIADAYLSVATPVQLALPELLVAGRVVRSQILQRLRVNLSAVQDNCKPPNPITALSVEAGFYAVLRLPNVMSDEEWTIRLLDEERVVVQPGFFYDFRDDSMLVLSLLPEPKTFSLGLQRIQQCVSRHI